MWRPLLGAVALLGFAAALALPRARADEDRSVEVARGRYLATVGDCVACHTGPGGPFAGGRAIATPFGAILAANLTPDVGTGIGGWTAEDFWHAMHEGRRPGGMPLCPVFPYVWYTNVTRADADAIFAYLRSQPAVANAVDRDALPFPFDIRTALEAWNGLFFRVASAGPDPERLDPARSAAWNRGAYLVEGLGHCGACHTPKNPLGADRGGAHLQGGEVAGQDWWAPNLTGDVRQGIGAWSEDELVGYLRTGRNDRAVANGPMAEAVAYSTSRMTEADLRAIATYLREQPAAAPRPPIALAPNEPRMRSGEAIFVDNCSACHTRSGEGIPGIFPRLAGSQVVQQEGAETLLRVVLSGARGTATDGAPTNPAMPSYAWRLDDAAVADVLTYVRNAWGNAAPAVSPEAARRIRAVAAPAHPG